MRRTAFVPSAIAFLAIALAPTPTLSAADPVHEVQVVAKQFTFEPAAIQVTAGEQVRLVIRSADKLHGFAIHDLKIDVQVPRSGSVVVEFTAPKPGRYQIACSELCGSGHGQMKAALVSVAPIQTTR